MLLLLVLSLLSSRQHLTFGRGIVVQPIFQPLLNTISSPFPTNTPFSLDFFRLHPFFPTAVKQQREPTNVDAEFLRLERRA